MLTTLVDDFQCTQHRKIFVRNHGDLQLSLMVGLESAECLYERSVGAAGALEDVDVAHQGCTVTEDIEQPAAGAASAR